MVMTDASTWQQLAFTLLLSELQSLKCPLQTCTRNAEAQCEDDADVSCIARGETWVKVSQEMHHMTKLC